MLILYFHLFVLLLSDQPVKSAIELINEMACGNCHSGLQTSTGIFNNAPDLNLVSTKYPADFIADYLQNPVKLQKDIGASRMPDFMLSEKEAAALTLYLDSRVPDSLDKAKNNFSGSLQQLKENYPGISIENGRQIFGALNCQACHNSNNSPVTVLNAPDLSFEGSRVKESWLISFLSDPHAVRPFGYLPGSGSRMPDFNLTAEEVNIIAEFLMKRQKKFASGTSYKAKELSPFFKVKAEKLIKNKLSCLGCHQFKGIGGRIAPELASAHERLQPEYIYTIINNPAHIADSLLMPRINMPGDWLELTADFINYPDTSGFKSSYLSLIDHETIDYMNSSGTGRNYLKYCAACHGINGNGDGYNSLFLPVKPTRFNNKDYMQKRPDDTLYDGIYAGGYILNKSHLMPSWGFTLPGDEIRNLVIYLRELCDCDPPSWSRD